MRGLQEDPAKNVIPYGTDATLSDNVSITHAEAAQEFVRLNPKWKPLEDTLAKDSTRKYRLNRKRWSDVKEASVGRVDAVRKPDAESVEFTIETEPMAHAVQKVLRFRCGENVKIETDRDTNGDHLVRVWLKSAAEGAALGWLCEGFKQGYHWGKQESPGSH